MIHSVSSSPFVRLSPVAAPAVRGENPPEDGFQASEPAPQLLKPGLEKAEKRGEVHVPGLWRQSVLTTCLAVGAVGGVLSAFPITAAAQVQTQPAQALKQSKDPVIRQLVSSSLVTGKIPPGTTEQKIAALPAPVRQNLDKLPPTMQKAYTDLDGPARKWLSQQINGSTETLFGKVQHRKAFISGRVAILNIFDLIKGQVADRVKEGYVPKDAQPRINQLLQQLKQLKSGEREALVKALEAEFPR